MKSRTYTAFSQLFSEVEEMKSPPKITLRILLVFSIVILLSGNLYAQGSKTRMGVGFTYSNPLSDKFKKNAGSGFGLSLCWFSKSKSGYGVGSLEYIRYDLPHNGETENYYQIALSGNYYGNSIGGFHPLFGAIVLGYHNWPEREVVGPTLGDIKEKSEKLARERWLGAEDKFFYFPFTFYSLGLGYEHLFSEKFSIDLSAKYSFNLLFNITSWQVTLSIPFL